MEDRLVPPFFFLMIFVWIVSVYLSSDIVIKIEKEEKVFIYLTQLQQKLHKIIEQHNVTNSSHS